MICALIEFNKEDDRNLFLCVSSSKNNILIQGNISMIIFAC